MIKFQKLVTGATDLETRMQRYYSEARDGGYTVVPLHVPSGGRRQLWWWLKLSANEELAAKAKTY